MKTIEWETIENKRETLTKTIDEKQKSVDVIVSRVLLAKQNKR